jgi:large subunit ribosomal protein L30
MRKIRITQIKSGIDYSVRQKRTLVALGLRKMHAKVDVAATPQILGMVEKVHHLVKVEELGGPPEDIDVVVAKAAATKAEPQLAEAPAQVPEPAVASAPEADKLSVDLPTVAPAATTITDPLAETMAVEEEEAAADEPMATADEGVAEAELPNQQQAVVDLIEEEKTNGEAPQQTMA